MNNGVSGSLRRSWMLKEKQTIIKYSFALLKAQNMIDFSRNWKTKFYSKVYKDSSFLLRLEMIALVKSLLTLGKSCKIELVLVHLVVASLGFFKLYQRKRSVEEDKNFLLYFLYLAEMKNTAGSPKHLSPFLHSM